ncbi:MAG TPA: carbohydrate kinase [Sphingobacteriaceae bacterium]|nr:carbohydrate kinase [Sphingobacteriaceae bacterium]
MNSRLSIPVYCFGEILWDVLPDGPQPGGAPFNVSYHLTKLKVPAGLISRIGDDENGRKLEALVDQWDVKKHLLQTDPEHDTSQVLAKIDAEKNEVSYEIVFPVAWDFIELNAQTIASVKEADYFVYGSLVARNDVSRNTLLQLLDHAKFKVLDINLRPPFFEWDLLELLLGKADLLKVNKAELDLVQEMLGVSYKTETEQVNFIKEKFNIREVIVTKGEHGASYYTKDNEYHTGGVPVKVSDTIGSGDSFLATVIANHYFKESPGIILKKAVAMGSFIAGKKGGCPSYDLSEYQEFYKKAQS